MPTRGSLIIKALIEEAKANGVSKKQLASAMHITPAHLSNLLGGRNEWRLSQIESLCHALKISLAELFLDPNEKDLGLFVLLKKILEAGSEPYQAIAWNLHGIAKQIEDEGPNLDGRSLAMFINRQKPVKEPGKKSRSLFTLRVAGPIRR